MKSNLVLIGMPGSGKSTVGPLISDTLKLKFQDTDDLIRTQYQRSLAELIKTHGNEGFFQLETNCILELSPHKTVIATGGSVVYSEQAMQHLSSIGHVIYLKVPLEVLEERLGCLTERGVIKRPSQSFTDLYHERTLLYEKYAEHSIEAHFSPQHTAQSIALQLQILIH